MSTTTGAKLLANVLLFVLIARYWKPEEFGSFVFLFTISTTASLISDYGFSQSALVRIGRKPENIEHIATEIFCGKNTLTILLLAVFSIFSFLLDLKNSELGVLALLLIAATINSYTELLFSFLRGLGKYKKEATVSTIQNIAFSLLTFSILTLDGGPTSVSTAILLCRICFVVTAFRLVRKEGIKLRSLASIRHATRSLKDNFFFGLDSTLTNLFSNLDTLAVGSLLGHSAVGIYQAGMRLIQGANTFAPVITNVFLPTISKSSELGHASEAISKKLHTIMLISGSALSLPFISFPELIVGCLYGKDYKELEILLPWMGILLFLRYQAAAHGIMLAGLGFQATRALSYGIAIPVFIGSAFLLIPAYSLIGAITSSIVSVLTLHVIYIVKLRANNASTGFSAIGILITILTGLSFWLSTI